MKFIIEVALVEAIGSYLIERPFKEVERFITALRSLEKIQEDSKIEENKLGGKHQ